eukprot:TRINITY_DN23778_c0_g1_i1.p1 TRINITY_DN23778_c0_g1~~TRINITY_DN23778_c0_g1_i1.p1  ORF type:complete len:616 (+),score=115.04 TRINITY_DN23778_c0_g1_i1:3-1850(+)
MDLRVGLFDSLPGTAWWWLLSLHPGAALHTPHTLQYLHRSMERGGMPVDGVLETSYGKVMGECLPLRGVWCFHGIPFAQPPIGANRFKKPKALQPWSGVLDCTSSENNTRRDITAMQADDGAEDCLYLDLWMPQDTLDYTKKPHSTPVMVILHPGAPLTGSKNDPRIDGTHHASNGVITVVPNFRLGALGFLRFADGDYNCALWDVIAVLEWVSKEIHTFGGSAECLTLCGIEGGADMAMYLLASPQSNRYFQRVILQNPGVPLPVSESQAQEIATEMMAVMGMADDEKHAQRNIPQSAFLNSQANGWFCVSYCFPGTRHSEVPKPTPPPPVQPLLTSSGLVIMPNAHKGVRRLPVVADGSLVKDGPLPSLLNGTGRGISCMVGSVKFRHQLADGEAPEISGMEELVHRLKWEFLGAPGITDGQAERIAETLIAAMKEEVFADSLINSRTETRNDIVAQHIWDGIVTDLRHGLAAKLLCTAIANDVTANKGTAVYSYVFTGFSGLTCSSEGEISLTHGNTRRGGAGLPSVRKEWTKVWREFATTGRCQWEEYSLSKDLVTRCDGVRGFSTARRPREKFLSLLVPLYVSLWPVPCKHTWDEEPEGRRYCTDTILSA